MKQLVGQSLPASVQIWQADLDGDEWPAEAALPPVERKRAAAIVGPRRRRWVASRWALRTVLAHQLGEEPEEIELEIGPRGKPELARNSGLRFNLSHSADIALIAIARNFDVGIDVEHIGSRDPAFYDAWARREAIAKCLGVGLGAPLPETPVTVTGVDAGPRFAAVLATAERGRR